MHLEFDFQLLQLFHQTFLLTKPNIAHILQLTNLFQLFFSVPCYFNEYL